MSTPCATMELSCISHIKKEFFLIEWISIEGPTGSIVILPNHSSIVSIIKEKGTVRYKISQESITDLVTKGGIFIFNDNKALLLLDT